MVVVCVAKNIVAVCSATTNDELRIYVSRNLGKIPVTLFFKTFDDRVGSGQVSVCCSLNTLALTTLPCECVIIVS